MVHVPSYTPQNFGCVFGSVRVLCGCYARACCPSVCPASRPCGRETRACSAQSGLNGGARRPAQGARGDVFRSIDAFGFCPRAKQPYAPRRSPFHPAATRRAAHLARSSSAHQSQRTPPLLPLLDDTMALRSVVLFVKDTAKSAPSLAAALGVPAAQRSASCTCVSAPPGQCLSLHLRSPPAVHRR